MFSPTDRPVRSALLWLAAIGAGAAAAPSAQTFRAASDLVVLQVAAFDSHSAPVSGLTEGDFRVFEDRRAQTIGFFLDEDRPVAVGLVVDNSTSMFSKRAEVVAAADAFAQSSNKEDALFVVNFNEDVSFGLPPDTPFTSDRSVLHDALAHIQARGQTAMYDGIAAGLDRLNASPLDQKVLVVVSDGDDNRSRLNFADVLARAQRSNAAIYAIGLFDAVEGGDHRVLERLAAATGGVAFFPQAVRDVRGALDQIARDIRHRYTIGYVPTNARRDGTLRQISVAATDPHTHRALRVRVRTGYLAASDAPNP